MVLMMIEFTWKILARLILFYKENKQNNKRVFLMQNFWGETWYMSSLLVITFNRKILLMQGLKFFNGISYAQFWQLSKKWRSFEVCWNCQHTTPTRSFVLDVATETAFSSGILCDQFHITLSLYYFILSLF